MITNNSIGVNVDWVHLGGGYASDAAAEAAWVAYAAHQSIYPVYQADGVTANLPTGYAYFNTGTNRLRTYNGSSYDEYVPGAGAALSLDGSYNNGSTITVDAGAIVLNDSDAAAAHTFDINRSGATSGNAVDITYSAAATGNSIDINFSAAATGDALNVLFTNADPSAQGIVLSSGTALLSGTWGFSATAAAVTTGPIVGLTSTALATGDFIDLTYGTATGAIGLDINVNSAATVPVFDIDVSALASGNIFDFASSAAYTGDVLSLDMSNAVAAGALVISGAGARTDSLIEITDSSTSNVPGILYTAANGPQTAPLMEFDVNTNLAQPVLRMLLGSGVAAGSSGLYLDDEGAARAGTALHIEQSSTSSSSAIRLDISGTGSGHAIAADVSAVHTGNVLDIGFSAAGTGNAIDIDMNAAAVAASAIVLDESGNRAFTDPLVSISSGTGVASGAIFDLNIEGAGSSILFDVDASAAATGNVFDFDVTGALWNADVINISLENADPAAQALVFTAGNRAWTEPQLQLTTGNQVFNTGAFVEFNVNGAGSSNLIEVTSGAVAYTGSVFSVTHNNATLASRIFDLNVGSAGGGVRTVPVFDIDSAETGDGSNHLFDINYDNAFAANVFHLRYTTAAATGDVFNIDMESTADTANVFVLDCGDGTWSGNRFGISTGTGVFTGDVIDVNVLGAGSGNILDVPVGAVAWTGDVIGASLGATSTASRVMDIDVGAGSRSVPLIDIATAETGTGANHAFQFVSSGVYAANVIDVAYAAGATGDVLHVLMDGADAGAQAIVLDTNLAFTSPLVQIISDTGAATASCISVATTSVGANGVAAGLTMSGSGVLVAGADLVRLSTGGNVSASSNILALEVTGGAPVAGSRALYINATNDMEAIHCDAGTVLIDEACQVGADGASALTIGTGANVATITAGSDAGLTWGGSMRPTKDLWLPADLWTQQAGDTITFSINNNRYTAWFDDSGGDESIVATVLLPYDYADAGAIGISLYLYQTLGAAGNTVWQIGAGSLADTADVTSVLTAGSVTGAVATPAINIVGVYNSTDDANISIPAGVVAAAASGELLTIELHRVSSDPNDTFGGVVYFLGARLTYLADLS